MKKISFPAVILFLVMLSASTAAQELPNSGFEIWYNQGNYMNPQEWDTPNSALSFLGITPVTRSNDAYSGDYSLRLETKSLFTAIVPAVATLGTITVDLVNQNAAIDGGIPYTNRPQRMEGFYKYTPQGIDSCAFIALFFKYNTELNQRDTLGHAMFFNPNAVTEWTHFSAEVNWSSTANPDTTNIILLSTSNVAQTLPGSVLLADNISYESGVGIEQNNPNNKLQVELFPNPATNRITVSIAFHEEEIAGTLKIYSSSGKLIRYEKEITSGSTLNVSRLPEGIYYYHFTSPDNDTKSGKLFIIH
ncbi:MAG: PCMD domain-containing protein [Bacteroidales bacterium]|nr:PCMD domain-containing protein [Bacteroidales bacterium]MDD3960481.1 PCMD domain-containing protein [Bacteroidales bacterium]HPE86161.1 PCMD domain-containing protein [Bacteroidales bacterium]